MAARVLLGAVFLWASLDKLRYPQLFADLLVGYHVLPTRLVTLVALVLPWLELLGGALLCVGLLSVSSAILLGCLSLVFLGANAQALLRGINLDCGCFSMDGGGLGWSHLGLNLVLLLVAVVVIRHGPGPLALDLYLMGARPQS